jgi:hypothetical protein
MKIFGPIRRHFRNSNNLKDFRTSPVAQFQNEDRIKISIRTVQSSLTSRKQTTSESALHRITQRASRISISASAVLLELIHEVH